MFTQARRVTIDEHAAGIVIKMQSTVRAARTEQRAAAGDNEGFLCLV